MKAHHSLATILIISIILIQFCGILACSEGKDLVTTKSLAAMAAQDPSEDVSFAEAYINRTRAESAPVLSLTQLARESRANLSQGNDGNMNDSTYMDLMEVVRIQYLEDLNYSSYILDEFVNKKIDAKEAMTSTTTLFILTSKTVDMVDQMEPPAKFVEYQRLIQLALINLEGYLWNMIKFYETNRRVYAIQAHDNFNKSSSYYREAARSLPKA
jgi:hypothetical protein